MVSGYIIKKILPEVNDMCQLWYLTSPTFLCFSSWWHTKERNQYFL